MGECINYIIAIFFIFYVLGCTYAEPEKAEKKLAEDEKIDKKLENIKACFAELEKNKMVTLDNDDWKPVTDWKNKCLKLRYFSGFIQNAFGKGPKAPKLYCNSKAKSTDIITEDEKAEKKLALDACLEELKTMEFLTYDSKNNQWINTEHWSTKTKNFFYFSGFIENVLADSTEGPVFFCNSRSEFGLNNKLALNK